MAKKRKKTKKMIFLTSLFELCKVIFGFPVTSTTGDVRRQIHQGAHGGESTAMEDKRGEPCSMIIEVKTADWFTGSKVEYPLWLDWRKLLQTGFSSSNWLQRWKFHAFRDESLLENRLGKHRDILSKWKAKASLKISKKRKRKEWQIEGKKRSDGKCIKRMSRGQQLANLITCDRLEDCFRNRAASEGSSYKDHLSVRTGKKLLRSFSEKEIVVAEEALRNKSKVLKRRLGLWWRFQLQWVGNW